MGKASHTKRPIGYVILHWWARIFGPILFQIKVTGNIPLPSDELYVYAANHQSMIDPPLVSLVRDTNGNYRYFRFVALASTKQLWIVGRLIQRAGIISLSKDSALSATRTSVEKVRSGESVFMFPEGTRTLNGKIQPGQPGIGMIVRMTNALVVPIRIKGSENPIHRGGWKMLLPRKIEVIVGSPLSFEGTDLSSQQISDQIMSAIQALAK